MLEHHITREGKRLLIAQMDDEHLNNFVSLILSKVKVVQNTGGENVTEFHRVLYNLPKIDESARAESTREALQRLYPYLAEAYLRGLEGPRKLLIDVLGREEAVPNYEGILQIPGQLPRNLGDLDEDPDENSIPF